MDKKKDDILNEHLEKIKYRFNYAINEAPKYNKLIKDESEFDELPDAVHSTQDGFPMPNTQGTDAYLEEDDEDPRDNEENTPEEDSPEGEIPLEGQGEEEGLPPVEGEELEPEQGVDELQNEIIKHNIQAMKDINDKLKSLDDYVKSVNTNMAQLTAKVKEVEEPTDAQKLMSKKEVSYPFYFNLPDVWKGSWFDQQRNKMQEKGIKELPDGTFMADFDDLPKHNDQDIESSFNNIV